MANELFKVEDTACPPPARADNYIIVSYRPGKQWWAGWWIAKEQFQNLENARVMAKVCKERGDTHISIWKLPGTYENNR